MKYIVIGLGNYGQVLAKELTELNHEVIGVDNDATKVEMIKDYIATSFILDATNELSLSILPLRSVDVVIVAIGEAFDASIKSVALLKKNSVKSIYARALNPVHRSVLEAFNIDLILTPEQDAARSLVQLLDLNISVESLKLDNEYNVMKFRVPKSLIGFEISDIDIENEFNLKIVSVLCSQKVTNYLGIVVSDKAVIENLTMDYKLHENDYIVCYGKHKDFISFWKSI